MDSACEVNELRLWPYHKPAAHQHLGFFIQGRHPPQNDRLFMYLPSAELLWHKTIQQLSVMDGHPSFIILTRWS